MINKKGRNNILHFADYHLKPFNEQEPNYSSWEREMFFYTNKRIHEIISKYNIKRVRSLGDIYEHEMPQNHEIELFDDLFKNIKIPIEMISGNHTKLSKAKTRSYYKDTMVEYYKNKYNIQYYTHNEIQTSKGLDLFCGHGFIEKLEHINKDYRVIYSHFRSSDNPSNYYTDEINTSSLKEKAELVILGDIHQRLAYDNIVYTGSPIFTHFKRNSETEDFRPSVLVLDNTTLEWEWVDTLGDMYNKKVKDYNSVQEFLDTVEELEAEFNEYKTFFKINIVDDDYFIKKLDKNGYKHFCIFKTSTNKSSNETTATNRIDKCLKDSLTEQNVSKSLLDYTLSKNKRPDLIDAIRGKFARLETDYIK